MVGNEMNGQSLKDINKINSLKLEEVKSKEVVHYAKDDSVQGERVKFEGLDGDSILSVDARSEGLPPIPDGGWGWVVVFAAFLTSACADGLAYSFGILHEEFIATFNESQSKTSLIGSLFISIPLISGPVMSALVDRYGCRIMTMAAGVIATLGFLLAAFCNSVEMLCLTLGVVSGLAMGIFYVTSVVAVAFWFDKRRTLAVSIASCGIGFGTLIYSPLTDLLIQMFDWRNTLVLLAGTVLNMCVCGALMRDPEWLIIKEYREAKEAKARSRRSSSAGSISSKSLGGESAYLSADELNELLKCGKNPEYILALLTTSLAEAEQLEATTQMNAEQSYKKVHSDIQLPTFIQKREKVPAEVLEKFMSNKRLYNMILQNYPDLLTRRRSEENIHVEPHTAQKLTEPATMKVAVMAKKPADPSQEQTKKTIPKSETVHQLAKTGRKDPKDGKPATKDHTIDKPIRKDASKPIMPEIGWLSRHINTDHHYLRDVPLYKNTIMHRGAMMNIPRYKLRASSLPDIYRNSTWSIWSESEDERRWYDRVLSGFKSTFNFKMFSEFHFFMFNVATLVLFVFSIIPYFFLKSYMTAVNVDGGATMISIIGISSAIGIVILGWAGDQPWLNVTKTFAVCLFVCGATIAAYPIFITNYWVSAVLSTVFGLSYASTYSYTPAILIELVPIDYFTLGYGLILLSQGVGHLLGPPLGGMLYDLTGSWELTFYMGGLWVMLAGGCVITIPYTRNRRLFGTSPLLKEEDAQTNPIKV
ncbi:uncharacterized protein LOC116768050 [Danaus plexippus]|uniref:uncharacterized protein LOC116768050 n=1 Tax=Danaus plexippus TaxID=13037 RepID=UPI002AB14F40|nr:uncharacterized protein LOC116768050 [Danaus plexippus]XP_061379414.1 uncharacterized protein LOC116768050 [Danaus plexippus]